MSVFLLILLAAFLLPSSVKFRGVHEDALSLGRLAPLKGVFILLVFATHFMQYVKLGGAWDAAYLDIRKAMGQLVVVPFLFFSGYGVALSIAAKGEKYLKTMPTKRFLRLLFELDLAVLLYVAVQAALGVHFHGSRLWLAFTGWTSVGNSNWYIFAVLILYALTYFAYCAFDWVEDARKRERLSLVALTALSFLFLCVLAKYRGPKNAYCYDTILAYTAGAWFFRYRDSFFEYVKRWKTWLLLFLALATSLWLLSDYRRTFAGHQVFSIVFAFLVVLFSLKVFSRNRILAYCGRHVFSLYILQRIPMICLKRVDWFVHHQYCYFAVALASTIALSFVFDLAMGSVENFIGRTTAKLRGLPGQSGAISPLESRGTK